MTDLDLFARAMDGDWEVVSQETRKDGRLVITYRSITFPNVEWLHTPFVWEGLVIPSVGTRGRLGFIASYLSVSGKVKERG